jgi:trans-2,3-dihydro-3-hydroxyanthranilate isomerase
MSRYAYRLVNVFSVGAEPFSGNPLCVFEDGRGLSSELMQALALQFNLSETTFILPSTAGDALVRIFTPRFELPFAGHPTLGTAHVLRSLRGGAAALRLEMKVGVVPVTAQDTRYRLQAQLRQTRAAEASRGELAAMLGLSERDLAGDALWVNAGVWQLLIPLASADAIARCAPDPRELERLATTAEDPGLVYLFAELGAERVSARMFFKSGSAIVEDPATGSACANLGGFLIERGASLPLARLIEQGEAVGRPSRLELEVDAERRIFVSGRVLELGRGEIVLP